MSLEKNLSKKCIFLNFSSGGIGWYKKSGRGAFFFHPFSLFPTQFPSSARPSASLRSEQVSLNKKLDLQYHCFFNEGGESTGGPFLGECQNHVEPLYLVHFSPRSRIVSFCRRDLKKNWGYFSETVLLKMFFKKLWFK